jgi:hypothetical protein
MPPAPADQLREDIRRRIQKLEPVGLL